jgi:hypothetical protein
MTYVSASPYHLVVSVAAQRLHVFDFRRTHQHPPAQHDSARWHPIQAQWVRSFSISTAKNGIGNLKGSFCTPRGRHHIRAKIGAGSAFNTVFVVRSGPPISPFSTRSGTGFSRVFSGSQVWSRA